MKLLLNKLTVCVGALALAFSTAACGDEEGDSDNDSGSDNDGNTGGNGLGGVGNGTGGTGGTAAGGNGTGGKGTGGNATGGNGTGGNMNASSILELAEERTDLSVFVDAVERAGLTSALGGDGLTVFAPTNAAFTALLAQLGLGTLNDLSPAQLKPILMYHVVDDVLTSAEAIALAPGAGKGTSLGGTFDVDYQNQKLKVDAATVTQADITAANGVVHVIDRVLLPSITDIVTTDPMFSEFNAAITAADAGTSVFKVGPSLDGAALTGPNWLVFIPRNQAFTGVTLPTNQNLTSLLFYHTVPSANPPTAAQALLLDEQVLATAHLLHNIIVDGGTSVVVRDEIAASPDATVVTPDIYAENGIIHVIDSILYPD